MKYFSTVTFYCVTAALSLLLFSACARKATFQNSVVVPSASGKVKVKKDNNNNYSISIEVKDLTPAENLVPPKQVYVVWNDASNGITPLGKLVTSRSFLARGYKASLDAVSPNKPNRIFITAENDPNTFYPGPVVVLTTPDF